MQRELKDKLRWRRSCFAQTEETNWMWKRYVQPIRSENFWRSTNSERVILPSSQAKLRKNALFIDQSVFSNFALCVIIHKIRNFRKNRWNRKNRNTYWRLVFFSFSEFCDLCDFSQNSQFSQKVMFAILTIFAKIANVAKNRKNHRTLES